MCYCYLVGNGHVGIVIGEPERFHLITAQRPAGKKRSDRKNRMGQEHGKQYSDNQNPFHNRNSFVKGLGLMVVIGVRDFDFSLNNLTVKIQQANGAA